jgi:hypothetical protein
MDRRRASGGKSTSSAAASLRIVDGNGCLRCPVSGSIPTLPHRMPHQRSIAAETSPFGIVPLHCSQPMPSPSWSKSWGSGGRTVKFLCGMSSQPRSSAGEVFGGMQKSGYDESQLTRSGVAVGSFGVGVGVRIGVAVGVAVGAVAVAVAVGLGSAVGVGVFVGVGLGVAVGFRVGVAVGTAGRSSITARGWPTRS